MQLKQLRARVRHFTSDAAHVAAATDQRTRSNSAVYDTTHI
jgi:hypothetical protein